MIGVYINPAANRSQLKDDRNMIAPPKVGRINVVDANGALRMVTSNKDRMHPGMMDGKMIDRPRPVAGLLFFNEEGDEVGGLSYTGREVNGRGRANSGLMFDQFKQDQTVGITYSETDGRRTARL